MIITIIFLIAIYILNIIDYCQTIYAIQLFGICAEANPIFRFLFQNDYAGLVKLIIVPIILILIGLIVKTDKRYKWAVFVLFTFYLCLVLYNFIVATQVWKI